MKIKRTDLERLAGIVSEAAEKEIIPRFRQLEEGAVREKTSALDLVTDADEAAEAHITAAVAQAFPSAIVKDRKPLEKIADAELAIIVDPVDGTSNFAWGLPLFGVLLAVASRGETIGGLIYDPIGRDFHFGLKGEGAWALSAKGQRRDLRVSAGGSVAGMTGVTSWYLMPEPMRSHVAASLPKVRATFAYRCAAHEYRLVCEGRIDFSLHYKLMPWDHAAGVLIHTEAGGYSALLDGTPYAPTRFEGGILSAPSRDAWTALRQALIG
jgi:fructose-1,6-bisphosphatase/inositol monophosphatase family enzyme